MSITNRIICIVEPEPSFFYTGEVPSSQFSINLTFECIVEQAEENDDEAAKTAFRSFLAAAQSLQFGVYQLDSSNTLLLVAEPDLVYTITGNSIPPVEDDAVFNWLETCEKKRYDKENAHKKEEKDKKPVADFWLQSRTNQADEAENIIEVSCNELNASQLLRSAQAWQAPVPQAVGLCYVVTIKNFPTTDNDDVLLIVPFSNDIETLPDQLNLTEKANDNKELYELEAYTFIPKPNTSRLQTQKLIKFDLNKLPSNIDSSGFLTIDPKAEESHRLLTRVEECITSQLSYPQLLDDKPTSEYNDYRYNAWRTVAVLSMLLDPFMIALTMPGFEKSDPTNEIEGDILATLVDCLYDAKESETIQLETEANSLEKNPHSSIEEVSRIREVAASLKIPQHGQIARSIKEAVEKSGFIIPSHLNPRCTASVEVKSHEYIRELQKYINRIAQLLNLGFKVDENKNYPKDTPDKYPLIYQFARYYFFGSESFEKKPFPPDYSNQLDLELADIVQTLWQENRVEATLQTLFSAILLPDVNSVETSMFDFGLLIPIIPNEKVTSLSLTIIQKALEKYKTILAENYNGTAVLQRTNNTVFLNAITEHAKQNKDQCLELKDDPDHVHSYYCALKSSLASSKFFYDRLLFTEEDKYSKTAFWSITNALWSPTNKLDIHISSIVDRLTCKALAAISLRNEKGVRFVPENSPAPLVIQIADNMNPEDLRNFNAAFNGINILIKQENAGWAYANLAEVSYLNPQYKPNGSYQLFETHTLHPFLPTTINGRGELFIRYRGFPLATQAFEKTRAEQVAETSQITYSHFVTHDAAELALDKKFVMPPPLAYGQSYSVCAFVTSNAGVLPKILQGTNAPWLPTEEPVVPPKINDYEIQTLAYRRKTAIGSTSIIEITGKNNSIKRIGTAIPDVHPLAHDYPRRVVRNGGGYLDILRSTDGSGALKLLGNASIEPMILKLDQVQMWGKPKTLNIQLLSEADATFNATTPLELSLDLSQLPPSITLKLTHKEGTSNFIFSATISATNSHSKVVKLASIPAKVWVRLLVKGENKPEDDRQTEAGISFVNPSVQSNSDVLNVQAEHSPLLLIAKGKPEFETALSEKVKGTIVAPRVGYLDFEYWLNNPNLAKDQFEKKPDLKPSFSKLLLLAYLNRHFKKKLDDTQSYQDDLAEALEALPDLSVNCLLVELIPSDTLLDKNSCESTCLIPLPQLETIENLIPDNIDVDKDSIKIEHLRLLVGTLNKAFSFEYEINADAEKLEVDFKDKTLKINVPAGVVAILRIRPIVSKDYIYRYFDVGMNQLVLGEYDDKHYIFTGTQITIESMLSKLTDYNYKEWTMLADKMISFKACGTDRRYELIARDNINNAIIITNEEMNFWRSLGRIEVQSQRWRFSGRPIYSWIDPNKALATTAAVQIIKNENTDTSHAAAQFEQELFFNRRDLDAEIVSKTLEPFPYETSLASFEWNSPSATLFRHRFVLHSRYEGALIKQDQKRINTWSADKDELRWPILIAMLADSQRTQLTRPQLRNLLPLTASTAPNVTPPILAFLQERPYAFGGLADRISAEIKTGIHYVIDNKNNIATVILQDIHKEIGLDPRLSYEPFKGDNGYTLDVEGPIGLTYDDPAINAPAFANCILSLTPYNLASPEKKNLGEHFLEIRLHRYIDPNWMMRPEKAQDFMLDRTWWITFKESGALQLSEPSISGGVSKLSTIIKVNVHATRLEVLINSLYLQEILQKEISLCDIPFDKDDKNAKIFILHKPTNATGKYSCAIFVQSLANIKSGSSNLPRLLTSIEWSLPLNIPQSPVFMVSGNLEIAPTIACAPTFWNWVRTNKNFDIYYYVHTEGCPRKSIHVNELIALDREKKFYLTTPDQLEKPIKLYSSAVDHCYPLQVQRHKALLFTEYEAGVGRPVENYNSISLLFGSSLASTGNKTENLAQVRIIDFELPAAVIYIKGKEPNKSIREIYQRPYLDLKAIGKNNYMGKMRLMIRLTNPKGLTHTQSEFQITIENTSTKNKHTNTLPLFFDSDINGFDYIYDISEKTEGLYVEITLTTAYPTTQELWANIGMLSYKENIKEDFDFDWIFSDSSIPPQSGIPELTPEQATQHEQLTKMVEAQARIISISAPIPIKK